MHVCAITVTQAGMEDWLVLVGLLHDMGKVMYRWGEAEDGMDGSITGNQWALGGDTWVVGCKIPGGVRSITCIDFKCDVCTT